MAACAAHMPQVLLLLLLPLYMLLLPTRPCISMAAADNVADHAVATAIVLAIKFVASGCCMMLLLIRPSRSLCTLHDYGCCNV